MARPTRVGLESDGVRVTAERGQDHVGLNILVACTLISLPPNFLAAPPVCNF